MNEHYHTRRVPHQLFSGPRGCQLGHSTITNLLANRALIGRVEYRDNATPERERREVAAQWPPMATNGRSVNVSARLRKAFEAHTRGSESTAAGVIKDSDPFLDRRFLDPDVAGETVWSDRRLRHRCFHHGGYLTRCVTVAPTRSRRDAEYSPCTRRRALSGCSRTPAALSAGPSPASCVESRNRNTRICVH